jgi:hypothetical protein
MNVSRGGGGVTYGRELIKARQNTFGGKPETKISDVGGPKITFLKVKFEVGRSKTVEEKLKT